MAYAESSLVRLGSAPYGTTIDKARSIYFYPSANALATIIAAGYFNNGRTRLVKGDVIHVVADQDGTPVAKTITVQTSPSTGNVTTALAGQQALTDNTAGTTGVALSANLAKKTVIMPMQNLDMAAGTIKLAQPFAGRVVGTPQWRQAKPVTTAAKLATATLGINGVAATGGVISLTSANCTPMGAAVAASAAVTAGGAFTAGQTIEFAFSAVTAFVEGDGWFEVTVIDDDLNNAIASLNAA